MIAITIDTEWSLTHMLEDLFSLLDNRDIATTVFATHEDGLNFESHERALHPNFFTDESDEAALASIAETYPDTTGVRSHGLHVYTNLRDHYPEHGIQYESNYIQYRVPDISPFWLPDGTLQFPLYWMDYHWLELRDGTDVPAPEALLAGPGLKVFGFHPTHVFYNTPSMDYYQRNKEAYYDEDTHVADLRWDGTGVRDVFVSVLDYIEAQQLETMTLGELFMQYRDQHPFDEL